MRDRKKTANNKVITDNNGFEAKLWLAADIRGIEADIGKEHADTFRNVQHPDLRADYVLANPPFNESDWFRKDDDVRWQFGVPPKGNANFAWVQHFIHHLAPQGMAGFVLANGSMSSNKSGEGELLFSN
jgi:type I restriction enzyme M protein